MSTQLESTLLTPKMIFFTNIIWANAARKRIAVLFAADTARKRHLRILAAAHLDEQDTRNVLSQTASKHNAKRHYNLSRNHVRSLPETDICFHTQRFISTNGSVGIAIQ